MVRWGRTFEQLRISSLTETLPHYRRCRVLTQRVLREPPTGLRRNRYSPDGLIIERWRQMRPIGRVSAMIDLENATFNHGVGVRTWCLLGVQPTKSVE